MVQRDGEHAKLAHSRTHAIARTHARTHPCTPLHTLTHAYTHALMRAIARTHAIARIYACVYARTHARTHACASAHTPCTHGSAHMHADAHTRMRTCTHARTNIDDEDAAAQDRASGSSVTEDRAALRPAVTTHGGLEGNNCALVCAHVDARVLHMSIRMSIHMLCICVLRTCIWYPSTDAFINL